MSEQSLLHKFVITARFADISHNGIIIPGYIAKTVLRALADCATEDGDVIVSTSALEQITELSSFMITTTFTVLEEIDVVRFWIGPREELMCTISTKKLASMAG